jgi:hypothetical protein
MDNIEEKTERRRWRYRGSLFGPLLLIAIGVLFLLSNTGAISGSPWDILLTYWPVILIVMSLDGLLRGEGLVGAVFMLAVGVVFLLSNLGVIALDIWEMVVRLWPLLLVAIGLDILVSRRSRVGGLIGLVILLGIFFAALWFMGAGLFPGRGLASEQINEPLQGVEQARVDLGLAVGALRLEALQEGDSLVAGSLEMRDPDDVRQDYSVQNGTAIYILKDDDGPNVILPGRNNEILWDLALARSIPLDLDVSLGVGELELDLTELQLNSLDVNMGVGEARLTLPESGSFAGKVNGAVGQLVVIVPRGVGLRVHSGTPLGVVDVPDDYRKADRVYTSPDYENAESQIELNLSQAIGSLVIQEQ